MTALSLIITGCSTAPVVPLSEYILVADTGSMRPALNGGEVFPVIRLPYADLRSRDIALTWFSGAWHPHRLTTKFLGRWKTKGDANPREDDHQMTPETYGGIIIP